MMRGWLAYLSVWVLCAAWLVAGGRGAGAPAPLPESAAPRSELSAHDFSRALADAVEANSLFTLPSAPRVAGNGERTFSFPPRLSAGGFAGGRAAEAGANSFRNHLPKSTGRPVPKRVCDYYIYSLRKIVI